MRNATKTNRFKHGFTLVELLVVIAVIGVLVGITLPAVQSVREAARRANCANKLKQIGVALTNYQVTYLRFPAGAEYRTAQSWASRVLPFLERNALHDEIDFNLAWNDVANGDAWRRSLPDFLCPSSWKTWDGATDYCGISGSWMGGAKRGSRNGMLFVAGRGKGVRPSEIQDGMSNTIFVAEGAAVTEENSGYWANGMHCFSHDDGGVNNRRGGFKEIASLHPSGAQVVFCDVSVHFLSSTVDPAIVGALCTRNGAEVISDNF